MEQSGLLVERDQVLKLARERNPRVARIVDPVLAGQTTLQASYPGNPTKRSAKPATRADASYRTLPDPRLSLARSP